MGRLPAKIRSALGPGEPPRELSRWRFCRIGNGAGADSYLAFVGAGPDALVAAAQSPGPKAVRTQVDAAQDNQRRS